MVKTYTSDVLKDFIDLESEFVCDSQPDFSLCVSPELVNINPDEKWTFDGFVEASCSESWQKDEINEVDHIALKHLFFRLMVPKDRWKDCSYDKFIAIVKQKYKQRLNEDEE